MNALVVYAHPEPKSFNGALRDLAVAVLTAAGHAVKVSDLYAMGFKAVADRDDFSALADPDFLKYQREQRHACEAGTFTPDIVAEQEKLRWADVVIFQFPLWWFGVPAILKGWFDRVLAMGFAYGGGRWFDTAPLRGRRALLCLTTGGGAERFRDDGLFGDLHTILHPIEIGVLNFVGLDVLEPFVAWSAASVGEEQRQRYLAAFRERLLKLESETPRQFHSLANYPNPAYRGA